MTRKLLDGHYKTYWRYQTAARIVHNLTDKGCRIALMAVLLGHSTLQALLIGQSYKKEQK